MEIKCEHCDKTLSVKSDAVGKKIKCPACQKVMRVPQVEDDAYDLNPKQDRKVCPSCQTELKPGAVLCVSCGLNLQTGQKLQATSSESADIEHNGGSKKNMKHTAKKTAFAASKIMIYFLGLLFILIGLGLGIGCVGNALNSRRITVETIMSFSLGIVGFSIAMYGIGMIVRAIKWKKQ